MKRSLALLVLGTTTALATGCGGSSGSTPGPADTTPAAVTSTTPASSGGTAPDNPTAAKTEITTMWETFFHTGTARSEAVSLLEDGSSLGAALTVAEQEDTDAGLTRRAKVKLINFTSPTQATVTWILYNKKTPLLNNASGVAVLVDGHWKVSKLTFCTLLSLGANGKDVPGC
jgi:hypothetical protein